MVPLPEFTRRVGKTDHNSWLWPAGLCHSRETGSTSPVKHKEGKDMRALVLNSARPPLLPTAPGFKGGFSGMGENAVILYSPKDVGTQHSFLNGQDV